MVTKFHIFLFGCRENIRKMDSFQTENTSLKERSVPPPVEDGNLPPTQYSLESYINQEPLSPSESYPIPETGLHGADRTSFAYNYGSLSVDEKKEFLVVTRNSLDLLSSILNTETEPKPIKDYEFVLPLNLIRSP
ncbi:hypothetical protein CICLE_v10023554mg [Citrus x clementina]|uniref:Uncharacterized protein n=1 Tax=Citrus clementina TaxID=85681 RepID=V4VUX4_CITCL|nr:hypothetical protein CICLE_v10023554mg [Citrus x clementina]